MDRVNLQQKAMMSEQQSVGRSRDQFPDPDTCPTGRVRPPCLPCMVQCALCRWIELTGLDGGDTWSCGYVSRVRCDGAG